MTPNWVKLTREDGFAYDEIREGTGNFGNVYV